MSNLKKKLIELKRKLKEINLMKAIEKLKELKKHQILKGFVIFIAFLITIFLIKSLPQILSITLSLDKFNEYIVSMGYLGIIVFILFQVLQTVIAPIPGEVIQIAGGYIYGSVAGTIYSTLGLIIGAAVAFYFTRLIGGDFVVNILKKKNLKWMLDVMESKKFQAILFIIFVVPGLPKDFMIYVAGLTTLKPMRFFVILITSRLPWIIASVSVGSNIYVGNYLITILISFIAIIGFLIGIFYKDRIIKRFSKEG